MAEKLKSISRQIHWSLLLKAAVFALAWFFLPFWLFFLVALGLYFIPFFQSSLLFWPFFTLMVLAYLEPADPIFVIVFALLFYGLLLIKDLLLIDRKAAYEILVFGLSFFLIRSFYEHLGAGLMTGASVGYGFLVAALIGLLVASSSKGPMRRVGAWLAFILVWQFLLLGLFLPLDFTYQATVIFLVSVLVIDFIPDYYPERGFATSVTVGALLLVVLLSAHWGLS